MNRSEQIHELAAALVKAQAAMRNPAFDRINPAFKSPYASLAAIRDAVIPALTANGLAVVQSLRAIPDGIECETLLMHTSGQWLADTLALPAQRKDAQGLASASTYCRRYALQSLVCVVGDTDDDGEGDKTGNGNQKQPPATTSLPPRLNAAAKTLRECKTMHDLKVAWADIRPDDRAALSAVKDEAKAAIAAAEAAAEAA